MKRLLTLTFAALLFAGCSTTPAERISKQQASFDSWPAAVQAQVREAKIDIGFTPEQVRMALGEPDRVQQRTTNAGDTETWVYAKSRMRLSVGIGVGGGGGNTSFGGSMRTGEGPLGPDDKLRVFFENGKVTAIERPKR